MQDLNEAAEKGDFEKVKLLLSSDKNLVNRPNEQGIFPLQQACFRGHIEVAEYLLKNGADVNARDRSQGYTALMFAAITGNLELTELLLLHGARSSETNKLERDAAQLASFVGNPAVSTLINNFVAKEEVDRYTSHLTPAKLKLHQNIVNSLYRLIIAINFCPVKVFLNLNLTTCGLLDHWQVTSNVLDDLLEKYFTPHRTHEGLALKFHLLACCLRKAGEHLQNISAASAGDQPGHTVNDRLGTLIKQFLKGADPHGLPVGQEVFLRQVISSFPHCESVLWQIVVRRTSSVQPGFSPSALSILKSAINGQHNPATSMSDSASEVCAACDDSHGKTVQIKLCQGCKEVGYCSVTCQRLHWFTHKKYCHILKGHHDRCEKSQKAAARSSAMEQSS